MACNDIAFGAAHCVTQRHCVWCSALRDAALRLQQSGLCVKNTARCHCANINVMTLLYLTKGQPSVGLCSQNIMCRHLTPNFTKLPTKCVKNTDRNLRS